MKLGTLSCAFVCGAMVMLLMGDIASIGAPAEGEQELRQAVEQSARISDFHTKLKPIKGAYDQKMKWWPAPGAEPLEAESWSDTEWLMGYRFMMQKVKGKWLDMPFEGLAILGYDTSANEYNYVWFDTLGTKMLFSRGACPDPCVSITMHGEYLDALTGETVKARSVLAVPDRKGETTLELYRTTSGGDEFKFLEVASTRKLRTGA